jgi:hypothetical protein
MGPRDLTDGSFNSGWAVLKSVTEEFEDDCGFLKSARGKIEWCAIIVKVLIQIVRPNSFQGQFREGGPLRLGEMFLVPLEDAGFQLSSSINNGDGLP